MIKIPFCACAIALSLAVVGTAVASQEAVVIQSSSDEVVELAGDTAVKGPDDVLTEEVRPWNLPSIPDHIDHKWTLDTEPHTRISAASRLTGRLGYPANRVARADRVHIYFQPGSSSLDGFGLLKLERLLRSANEFDEVVVTGYETKSSEAEFDARFKMATRRAEAVSFAVQAIKPSVRVRVDATPHWSGSQEDGKRAEVFLLKALRDR